jgi:hypothetical protein
MVVREQLEQFEQMLTRLGTSPEDKRLEEEVAAVLTQYEGVPSPERVRAVMGGVRYGVHTLRQLRDLGLHLSGPNYTQLARALVSRLDAELSRPEAAALPAWMHDLFVQELRMWLPAAANNDSFND